MVRTLLEFGKTASNLASVSEAFFCAVKRGHEEVVRILVDEFPTLIQLREKHRTPLHIAAKFGHLKLV